MRVEAHVLDALKATGAGWQTRISAQLHEAVTSGWLGLNRANWCQ